MSGKLIFGLMASVIMTGAWGASSTVTSRDYVDNALATKQVKIPSAGTAGATAGDSVITYTASSGAIGERGLFTGGKYNANTDGDKMITASALNNAFTNLPETETTKLTCTDSNCLLYNIITQTAYGITPFNPDVSIPGTSMCYRTLSGSGSDPNGSCGADTLSYLGSRYNKSGKWGVVFPYGDISGISVCSAQSGTYLIAATDAQTAILDSEYAAQAGVGKVYSGQLECWCKMENPVDSRWVFENSYSGHPTSDCVGGCASRCAFQGKNEKRFREAVFGAQ